MKRFSILLIALLSGCAHKALPSNFVALSAVAPTVQQDMRYHTSENFVGRPIAGYPNGICVLTKQAADAVLRVQAELHKKGLGLKVFDCYRPQKAVNDFVVWSKDVRDQKMKSEYYPRVDKAEFFELGYVAAKSGHTRGSTVDLTVIDLKTGKQLDMGGEFDFMDERSHPTCQTITPEQYRNRMMLRELMLQNKFKPLATEWWHFTLEKEPFPDTYFNFEVSK